MEVHASQISETSFFLSMSDDVFSIVWGHEWYIRVRPPWTGPTEGHRETGFLLEAAADRRGEAPAAQAR
jgi:hypothetical protein